VKILINLQVGSVRVWKLRGTLCLFKGSVVASDTWKPSRWSIPCCTRELFDQN